MIDDTIARIRRELEEAKNLSPERRQELLELIVQLRSEIAALSKDNPDQARSIAGFTQLSAHEAMRLERQPETMKNAIAGLESTVRGFEAAHPRLTEVVNRLAHVLSSLGI